MFFVWSRLADEQPTSESAPQAGRRRDHYGHPEGGAIELAAARRAVREDAGLPADEAADRVSQRLDEMAAKMQLKERAERDRGEWSEDEERGDVP